MNSTILAIDLGKYNSVLCWYQPEDRNAAFRTVATTPEVLRHELTGQPATPGSYVIPAAGGCPRGRE